MSWAGSVTKGVEFMGRDCTVFYLQLTAESGSTFGQSVAVPTARLAEQPHVYGRTLGFIIRDLEKRANRGQD